MRPWKMWAYKNGLGETVKRDNAKIFMDAADKMCRAMQAFRKGDLSMDLASMPGLPPPDAKKIAALIKSIKGDSGEDRHQKWLAAIRQGRFSFGAEEVEYIPKGRRSWKHQSIGQLAAADTGRETFTFRKNFMASNWKLFHDALQAHRLDVLHDVLPPYGICAA